MSARGGLSSLALLPLLLTAFLYGAEWALRRRYPTPEVGGAIIVSGASSGIGRDAALRLASLGYTVFAGVRTTESGRALRAAATASSGRVWPLQLDVASPASVAAAARNVQARLRGNGHQLVGLVNNAGIGPKTRAGRGGDTVDVTRRTVDVNVLGVVRVTEAFLPLLTRRRASDDDRGGPGRVVNVGSLAGRASRPNDLAYVASKHAIEGLTDGMRLDLAPLGVSVSLIQPGFVASSMCRHAGCVRFPNATTTPAIEDALLAAFPRTRYPVSDAHGIPAALALWMGAVLPDRLKDLIVLLFESA